MTDRSFEIVGACKNEEQNALPKKSAFKKMFEGKPVLSVIILGGILLGCLCAKWIMTKDPTYMDLLNYNKAPDGEFLFGTDTMGRDIFSMIWYGGRISLFIGFVAAAVSTAIAVVYGCISGFAPAWLDDALMRFAEMAMSIPSILVIIFLQAIFHTTQEKSDATFFKNSTIDARNAELQKLADNETVFYIDCNPVFDDSTGALTPEYSGDGVHVKAAYYPMWRDYLFQFGVVK